MLAGQSLSADGFFFSSGSEAPARLLFGPVSGPLDMSWISDSVDGWDGQMVFKGVTYNLTGSVDTQSSMLLKASPIDLNHAGSFVEPFTFSAGFCGYLTVPMSFCDTPVGLVGSGTLDLVATSDPNFPGSFDIQSISYQFTGVPEPGSLVLLLTGVVALGLTWRQSHGGRRAA